jgi:hypothetical protein
MKIKLPWQRKQSKLGKDLIALEKKLESTLIGVDPRSDFVKGLRTKVVGSSEKAAVPISNKKVQKGLLVAGGVVSILLMLLVGVRVIITILGTVGLIQARKKGEESTPASPPHPIV